MLLINSIAILKLQRNREILNNRSRYDAVFVLLSRWRARDLMLFFGCDIFPQFSESIDCFQDEG